ncbi:MAG: DUF1178 family protein [Pseudomonadota bacterium]
MIVFDLLCAPSGHVFEAWFASSDAFETQKSGGMVCCPICSSHDVGKALMAPNIASKSNQRSLTAGRVDNSDTKTMLAALAQAQAAVLENSSWVGRDFATQARAMDAGEIDKTSIHGEASHAEVKSLIDDGIQVAPLPLPVIPPNQSN